MSAPIAAVIAAEVAKVLLQMYFVQLQSAGLSAEEAEKLYLRTRLQFLDSNPVKIPEV